MARTAEHDGRGAGVNGAEAVRALSRTALDPNTPGHVSDLTRVVAAVTGCGGAVLWEAPDESRGLDRLSVLAMWSETGRTPASRRSGTPDPVTEQALRDWSLSLPDRTSPRSFGLPVLAALPIRYIDDCRGVLTLLGEGSLTTDVFDVAVDVVDVLPELCNVVRERQTLHLVHACNTLLHEADIDSLLNPFSDAALVEHLSQLCGRVAGVLHCTEVTIHLRRRHSPEALFELVGSSGGALPEVRPTTSDVPADQVRSGTDGDEQPLMEVRLVNGDRVEGMLRCRGSEGPPHHFTPSDLALLRPIAAQVSRYWRVWEHRRSLAEENQSWHRLAAGITSFNRLVAESLDNGDEPGDGARVDALAVQILQDVVPESATSSAFRAAHPDEPALTVVAQVGQDTGSLPAETDAATTAFRSRSQLSTVDAAGGWLLCTPIRMGEQVYGVLAGSGPDGAHPENSAQVHEIIGDQLGLYQHLQDTLGRLHEVRATLEARIRSEAEAMEDLKHQLVSPLRTATDRTEMVLRSGRFDSRAEGQLKAIRGLCRKASRVAMSAGVFATLSRGGKPTPKFERIGVDDLLRLLITTADDAQVLGNPRRGILFDVDRDGVRRLGRRLIEVDVSFLQQCVGNLLDNASKYAYEGTRVQVAAEVDTAQLALVVTSEGLPLARADAALCLGRNWRGTHARNATGEGSGIGLWIVDNLMSAMRGRVGITVQRDRTTVRLHFPLV